MKLRFTERAGKDYSGMPVAIRKAFGKQLRLLANRRRPPCTASRAVMTPDR